MNIISGKCLSKLKSVDIASASAMVTEDGIGKCYRITTVNPSNRKTEAIVFSEDEIRFIVRQWNKDVLNINSIKGE